ncbi:hypothetical protein F8568_001425 [Actinomadura sp. LD22]|uniref:Uncharacterized protein n=1 Tax=Actinomadura physcomitrii TaxID=2650748 RepID=A0A6I4M8Q7_9ACTN|nr:hypothetical protein [Actinomadura physcomitrii]MVZ99068.1 hypothetical protein [Actinomadura physcomitrii]
MPDRMEAAALALDAYQRHLFGDLANGHRTDHAEAQGLLHSLVADLIRYGEGNRLNVAELLDALIQARIDRGGALTNPRYSFRIHTEVQFRDHDSDPQRGFITELKSTGPGSGTDCTLRIPGISEPRHTTAAELQPATRMTPIPTRTVGTVFSAQAAEQTLISMLIHQRTSHDTAGPDERLHADLAELSTALAAWSGTTSEQVLHHLRAHGEQYAADDWPSAARCAAAAFPNDIAADLAREPPAPPTTAHPAPRRSGSRPHLT